MILRRIKGGYEPADNDSSAMAMKHKTGDLVECKLIKSRNPKFNAKFNAMIDLVASNQDRIPFSTRKQGRDRLLYAACHILQLGEFWGPDKQHFERKSFAFANMDEDEFSECYSQILDCFLMHFVKVGKEDFERQLLGFG